MGGDDHDSLDPMTAAQDCEPPDLPALTRRFQTWRASRATGAAHSPGTVASATAVARIHGISPTVAALKLNYYDRATPTAQRPGVPTRASSRRGLRRGDVGAVVLLRRGTRHG